ncbi:uncharacterized protein Afti isoform X2 [Chironomus tepperi]|uniref:uncharacterized protein Afti isoform X2 n=1 Tax=Chironomus tepperi TaxID=113505 RepID=UPI00391F0664
MSVYDCEPPQLDCDLPPPDEEINKRREHENDFDLDDEEISSYNRTINEHSTITNNVLHLYDSSPPPVDDFFIHKTSYEADDLEIPDINADIDEIENIHHHPVSAEVNDLEIIVPKDETITEKVINPPNLESTEKIEIQPSIEHKNELELTSNNNGDIKDTTSIVNDFILEDLPEDDDAGWGDDLETTVVNKLEELPEEQRIEEENLQNINDNVDDDDDDFDNFNDFEQAIPIDRHIEQQISIEKTVVEEPNEFQFEADFSAFEVNFDNQFQSFSNSNEGQEFHTSIEKTSTVIDDETFLNETNNDNDDDDDDFGDFNDFEHQGPSQETLVPPQEIQLTHQTLSILDDSEVKTILSEMFPTNQIDADDSTIYPIIHKDKGNENDMKIVNDVESTFALSYDYKDSSTNHILIKALGIDERNILFGPQWAASNMPRFASDLSFNPLEPAKFSSSSTSYRTNSTVNSSIITSKAKDKDIEKVSTDAPQAPDIVPEFDWSVAGLTNPLDGKQANTLKPNEESSLPYDLGAFDTTQKIADVVGTDIDNSLNKHIWQSERFEVANTIVRERTIKLPETHIFTPIKSISPVAREVSRESSPIENDKDKRSVVIKEYHDVEYSLESSKKTEQDNDFGDFNDFQSAVNDVPIQPLKPAILLPTNVLEPQKLTVLEPQKVIETKQPEIISTAVNDHDFTATTVTNLPNQVSRYDVFTELTKAPTKPIEDDFADFQAAPIILPQKAPIIEKVQHQPLFKEDSSLTLSPSRLANSMQKMSESSHGQQKVTSWMHDTLDSDEISRIEAAFPKCKIDSKKKQNIDDDEWCDFQSVSQSSNTVPNHTSDTKKMSSDNTDTSDWSDFVSVPIVKPSINASQFLSKPNFPSWNQPSKPYVNHTTSFLSSNNSHYDQSFYARNKQPMTITNNFNYNFERQDVPSIPPYQMSNGISTILPDLQFALPKTLINLSRGNGSDTTKK